MQNETITEVEETPIELERLGEDSLTVNFDAFGGHRYVVCPYLAPMDATQDQMKAAVKRQWPNEHCHHAYDCCGHYYRWSATFMHSTYYTDENDQQWQLVYVHFSYVQNV